MGSVNSSDYIGSNKDWSGFVTQVSTNTQNHYKGLWESNLQKNRFLIKKWGWAAELQESFLGKTAVLLGASPQIKNQIDTLRDLQNDHNFVFIGISSGMKMMFENGIRPRYIMIADADPDINRFWNEIDMEQTKGITLIANICTAPNLLAMWKGDIKFLGIFTSIKKMDKKIKKIFPDLNLCGQFFPALSSQYNVGAAFAFLILCCKILIFVGSELGFKTNESPYYPDRKDVKDTWIRKPHPDIYGNTVYTNYMLMTLKLTLEDFLGRIAGAGYFFNCTEAGILGVNKRYGNLPWIQQLTLNGGITQARHIMQTGEPLYI